MGTSVKTTRARAARILLLGDHISRNQSVLNNLRERHNVITSNGERELGNYLEGQSIDLIVLEISESPSEPLTALQLIKQQKPALKVIVINNGQSIDVVAKAFKYGAIDFFKTPVNVPLFCERIDALIRKH